MNDKQLELHIKEMIRKMRSGAYSVLRDEFPEEKMDKLMHVSDRCIKAVMEAIE